MCAIWCTLEVVYAGTVGYRGDGGGAPVSRLVYWGKIRGGAKLL